MEVENITKVPTFNSFLHLSYKNTYLLYLRQCFLIFLMRNILTDDFLGLHKKYELYVSFKYIFSTKKNCNIDYSSSLPYLIDVDWLIGFIFNVKLLERKRQL